MYDITPIVQGIAAIIGALITVFLIPYIRSKTGMAKQEQFAMWVKIAVGAAEQLFAQKGMGEQKKAYVMAFLHAHGMTVDEDELDALIESAVYALTSGLEAK